MQGKNEAFVPSFKGMSFFTEEPLQIGAEAIAELESHLSWLVKSGSGTGHPGSAEQNWVTAGPGGHCLNS